MLGTWETRWSSVERPEPLPNATIGAVMRTAISIADNIARLRKEAHLTQADLADFLGVTKASVSKWETGQSFPDIETLPKIATYFGISVDKLLGYEPQLTREGIRKACELLKKAFAEEPFEQARDKCRSLVRDYYACYPLLVQVATIYLNHFPLVEPASQQAFIEEAVDLCHRVRANASSSAVIKQAETIEAAFRLAVGDPQVAAELLESTVEIEMGADVLLAQAYAASGYPDKADETLQGTLFQSLVLDLNRLSSMAMLHVGNPEKLAVIHERALAVIDAFEFEKVFVNCGAIHLSFAMAFVAGGDVDSALDCLDDYERACRLLEFPVKLHGDEFFDKTDAWIEEVSTSGTSTPTDQAIIKLSMVNSVSANPAFAPLADNPRFKLVVKNLEEIAR